MAGLFGVGSMLDGIWDNPMVSQVAFHPRQVPAEYLHATSGPIRDGTFDVPGGEKVSYRMFVPPSDIHIHAVVYYFHANAEVCTDVGMVASFFHRCGAALLSVDYRGFAWSTGTPSLTKLCSDADSCFSASHAMLDALGCGAAKRIMWGRSIGATCAVHLAANHGGKIHGLIVESGLMSIKRLPLVAEMLPQLGQQLLGPSGAAMASSMGGGILGLLPEPCGTLDKMEKVECPTLVMHGDKDEIVPIEQGIECHEKCAATQKVLKRWEDAGHNNLIVIHSSDWSTEVVALINRSLEFQNPFPRGTLVEAHSLSSQALNGARGQVLGMQGERVRVRFEDIHGEKALKPANLNSVPDPFPTGSIVEAHSLSAAPLNGLRGEVLGMQSAERVRVRLPDPHGEKALKSVNLKQVAEAVS